MLVPLTRERVTSLENEWGRSLCWTNSESDGFGLAFGTVSTRLVSFINHLYVYAAYERTACGGRARAENPVRIP